MRTHDMVLLSKHGQVSAASDCKHVLHNAGFFQPACQHYFAGRKFHCSFVPASAATPPSTGGP